MTFSIGHWLIVLTFVLAPLAAVLFTGRTRRLNRGGYTLYILAYLGLNVALGVVLADVESMSEEGNMAVGLIIILARYGLYFLACRWTVMRINDMGQSRWLAMMMAVPLVNLVFIVALFFIEGQPTAATDSATQS